MKSDSGACGQQVSRVITTCVKLPNVQQKCKYRHGAPGKTLDH